MLARILNYFLQNQESSQLGAGVPTRPSTSARRLRRSLSWFILRPQTSPNSPIGFLPRGWALFFFLPRHSLVLDEPLKWELALSLVLKQDRDLSFRKELEFKTYKLNYIKSGGKPKPN